MTYGTGKSAHGNPTPAQMQTFINERRVRPPRFGEIKQASEVLLMSEWLNSANWGLSHLAITNPWFQVNVQPGSGQRIATTPHGKYGYFNYLFVDGHVEFLHVMETVPQTKNLNVPRGKPWSMYEDW